jgi:hypothetical protein
MARKHRETVIDDALLLPDGQNLTADQIDAASLETLRDYSDTRLRFLAEQCRHGQAMAEIELERRKSEGQHI